MNQSRIPPEPQQNIQSDSVGPKKPPLSKLEGRVDVASSLLKGREVPRSSLEGRSLTQSDAPSLVSIDDGKLSLDLEGKFVQEDDEVEGNEAVEDLDPPESDAEEALAQPESKEEKPLVEEVKPDEPEKPAEDLIKTEEGPSQQSGESEPIISPEEVVFSEGVGVAFNGPAQVQAPRVFLPSRAVDVQQLLIDKIVQHIEEKRSVEKERERETKTKEAVQASRQKAEITKAAIERFIVRLLNEKVELKEELKIEGWSNDQIRELARLVADVFFEGHSSYHSFILSKELAEG